MVVKPFIEILASLTIGVVAGFVISYGVRWFTGRGNRISLLLAILFLVGFISRNHQRFRTRF